MNFNIKHSPNTEKNFIKLYTKMWFDFNKIPNDICRDLFLQMMTYITYCNTNDLPHSKIVYLIGSTKQSIMLKLNIVKTHFHRLVKTLIKCNAIKKIPRGEYKINPKYARKGEWKYNPKLNRGGVEDLVATFTLSAKNGCNVETEIVRADDGSNTPYDNYNKENLGKNSMLKETVIVQKGKQ